MEKLRIFLADDHEMMREGLKTLINQQADMEVVGEAGDGQRAVALAKELLPDIIVMDVSMPVLNGLKATERLKQVCPEIKVVNLTRHNDASYLEQLLRAGSNGYVLKKSVSQELIRAIRSVASGGTYLDPAVTRMVINTFVGRRTADSILSNKELSGREEEVLRLTAWGYANKEISVRMTISVKTVEAHKANAIRKLELKGRADIVRYALLKGWLQETL
jgi:two-component system, NarL family, response regulator NreC